jgi:TatD DNase family protein
LVKVEFVAKLGLVSLAPLVSADSPDWLLAGE